MLGGLEGKSNSNSVLSFWVQIKEWLNSMLMWIIEKILKFPITVQVSQVIIYQIIATHMIGILN